MPSPTNKKTVSPKQSQLQTSASQSQMMSQRFLVKPTQKLQPNIQKKITPKPILTKGI